MSAPSAGHGKGKRAMSVQQALEWAFRVEKAQLELPERPDPEHGHGSGAGFGLEYVLMQRAALGCKIDGGRYKMGATPTRMPRSSPPPSPGCPTASAASAWRSAWELARAGLTPDWMPGAVPRCVPVRRETQSAWRAGNNHGRGYRAGSDSRGKWRSVEVLACPVTWLTAPGADRGRTTRLRRLVASAGLGAGRVDRRGHVAGGGGDGSDAEVKPWEGIPSVR